MKQYLQKTSLRLLLVAFLLSLLPGTVIWGQGTQPPGSGSSADNPYLISTRAHLEWMADQIENNTQTFDSKFFKLQNDIDLNDAPFTPIGREDGYMFTKFFAGTFDGDGYTISGLHFEASSHEDYGLFGQVGQNGVIKNLGVEISSEGICISDLRAIKAGGIAGHARKCTIENCYVTGGRIYCDGNFPTTQSYDEFYIKMGGIAGAAENTTIQNCFATIDIILEFENAVADYNLATYGISIAGITAGGDDAIITNCCYSGQLRAYAEYIDASPLCASGITGKASTVSNCLVLSRSIVASVNTNNSDPSNFPVSGNAIAWNCSSLTANYVSPETTLNGAAPAYNDAANGTKWENKTDVVAPLSTWIATKKWAANSEWNNCMPTLKKTDENPFQSSIKQPYVFKETKSINNATELAEINKDPAHLAGSYKLASDIDLSSYNSGNWTPIGSTATPFKGTFDGDGYMIEKLNVDLAYNGTGAQAGLFGVVENGTVENLGVQFETLKTLGDYANVGGIAGEAKKTTIRNCYAVGGSIITETSFTNNTGGGIIGRGTQSTIFNCYSICEISLKSTGYVYGGGIAGSGTNLSVDNCYSICKIKERTGSDASHEAIAGGIVGTVYGIYNQPAELSSISNCLALGKEAFDLATESSFPELISGRILGRKGNYSNATLTGNYATTLMPGNWTSIGADQNDGADWDGKNCTPSDPDAWDITWDNMTVTSRSITGPKLPKLKTTDKSKVINGQNDIDKLLYIGIKLTTTTDGNGTVEVKAADGTTYNNGDHIPVNTELTITTKPNVSYEVVSLKVSGSDFTSGSTYIAGSDLTTKGIDLSVEATFKSTPTYTVTVDDAISNGSIEVKKPDATTLTPGANTVEENTSLTITATPASGYQLKQLTADGNPISGNTYTVLGDVILSAEFEAKSGGDGGGGDGGGSTTPTVYYTVTLPAVEGATTDPIAGKHEVEAWSSFRFYLSVDKDYDLSVPEVTTSRGETITPRSSDGAYIIKYVRQPLEIFIDGIVKNPDPVANETIATDAVKVWAAKGNLHINTTTDQTVQVYNLAGLLVKQADISSGDTCWQLPSGIYIVRIDNQRYKVIL